MCVNWVVTHLVFREVSTSTSALNLTEGITFFNKRFHACFLEVSILLFLIVIMPDFIMNIC